MRLPLLSGEVDKADEGGEREGARVEADQGEGVEPAQTKGQKGPSANGQDGEVSYLCFCFHDILAFVFFLHVYEIIIKYLNHICCIF